MILGKNNNERDSSKEDLHHDKSVWLIWAGMMLITLIALPFIVRQTAVIRAIADMCMTTLSAGR